MNASQTNKGCGTYKKSLMEIQENETRPKLYSLSVFNSWIARMRKSEL